MEMSFKRLPVFAGAAVAAILLAGCNTDPQQGPTMPQGQVNPKVKELYQPEAQAGVALSPQDAYKEMPTVRDIAQGKSWYSRRTDAFALLAAERKFESEQSLERILSDTGGFSNEFEVPDPAASEEAPQSFPTPAWRLAGIVVSEGAVIALLDQGGRVDTVVPGQQVEGTEWRCISIDTEKAVFRRDPRRIPSEIVVPLQGGLPGQFGGGNAPSGGRNAPPQGGGGPGRPGFGGPGGDDR